MWVLSHIKKHMRHVSGRPRAISAIAQLASTIHSARRSVIRPSVDLGQLLKLRHGETIGNQGLECKGYSIEGSGYD